MVQEKQLYSRNQLVASLMKIKHGDLSLYLEEGLAAASAEPEVLAHFIAWNARNGKVRDAKVALPVIALRGLSESDRELAENAVVHLLNLPARDLVRSYDFSKKLSAEGKTMPAGSGNRDLFETGIRQLLSQLEDHAGHFDRVAIQHRDPLKRLYRISRKKPSPRAQAVLFDKKYSPGSIFAQVAALRDMTATEAAGVILKYKIPFQVVVGSVAKLKDKDILLALMERMTGNQVVTNSAMLMKMGVTADPVLRASYEAALERAKKDRRTDATLKVERAIESVGEYAGDRLFVTQVQAQLGRVLESNTAKLGSIDGIWAVFGDDSGSMENAIEVARKIAALLTERVKQEVYLIFFNTTPQYFEVTGKTYAEILDMTKYVRAGGGTAIGCGLDYLRARKILVQGIAIVSDGGERQAPMFAPTYQKYCQEMKIEPTVYLLRVAGSDPDWLSGNVAQAGLQMEKFDLGENIDYYSLPNIISGMRVNRYALYDEIMETPLLKFSDVFKN